MLEYVLSKNICAMIFFYSTSLTCEPIEYSVSSVTLDVIFPHRLRIAGAESRDGERRSTEGRRRLSFRWRWRKWSKRQTEGTANDHQSEATRDFESSICRDAETDKTHARKASPRNRAVHESDSSLVPKQTIEGTSIKQQRLEWLAKPRQISHSQERDRKSRHSWRNGWSIAWSQLRLSYARFVLWEIF